MEKDEDAKVLFEIQKRICRCCLNSSESMVNAVLVREAFLELAGITVDSSDGLPQWICTQCLTLLRKAVRFRRKIQHSDNILRDYLARCAPFPNDKLDPELSKHATQHLSQTQTLQFDTDKTKNGYHKVLQHVKPVAAVFDMECKIEYDEPIVKVEQYSDFEDDMPLLEIRSNKDDSTLEDMVKTPLKSVKRKKDIKSRKKKKKYQNESESHDESESHGESEDETYKNVTILEPLESKDPLESFDECTDLEKSEFQNEKFEKLLLKTQRQYLGQYKQFMRWKKEKNITSFSENVFLSYFNELDLKHKPPTLVATHSMLKTIMLDQKGIDLGKFKKLKKFLKDCCEGYCVKPKKAFDKENIDRFLKTAPDDLYLTSKVVLIVAICGGCTTTELLNLTVNDLEQHANLILVKIQEKNNKERSFMIPENYSEYIKKYMNLRPKNFEIDRFLVHCKDGVITKMAMGKNKVSSVAKEVATFLNLPNVDQYNGHGLRKTFHALFDPKKGSANVLSENESDSESENREKSENRDESENREESENSKNDSENRESEYENRKIDNEAESYDNEAESYDNVANFNDNLAESNYDETANDWNQRGKTLKIPEKSGKSYVRAYQMFAHWKTEKNIDNITEEVMIEFFKHLSKEFKPSSLWNYFSMLRNTILSRNNVDIKKFESLKHFLRWNCEGFEKRTSKVFTESEIDMFLSSAPDYNYLVFKVILILGISGACTNTELINLTTDNVKAHKNNIIVRIREGDKKIRRFSVTGRYYEYVKRYMDLRPKNLGHNRFFFPINNSNYTKQVIGKNTVRLIPREIASFLVLPNPEAYNGYCFKKTSLSVFGPRVCTFESYDESENHTESEIESENGDESDDFQIKNESMIRMQNIDCNDSENERVQIVNKPTVKLEKYENHNESGNFEIKYEPIVTRNIKQETFDNNTIKQENITRVQKNSTNTPENSTNTLENSTDSLENSTNTLENSTNSLENSTNTLENSTNSLENSTNSLENSSNITENSINMLENKTEKSQFKYLNTYGLLQTWMIENDFETYTENVLLQYFKEISTKLKPNSLASKYSMLRLPIKERNGVDIFEYMTLRNFVNENNRGFHSKKSKVFSSDEVEKFLESAPDHKYLHFKVALIFGISGACRCKELIELSVDNIKIRGKIITVKILSDNNKRKFFVQEKYVHIVKKYIDLRPNICKERFFLSFRGNKCVRQVVGKNCMGRIPQQIAKYLNLPNPEEYTAHCFRRTSFSLLGAK